MNKKKIKVQYCWLFYHLINKLFKQQIFTLHQNENDASGGFFHVYRSSSRYSEEMQSQSRHRHKQIQIQLKSLKDIDLELLKSDWDCISSLYRDEER